HWIWLPHNRPIQRFKDGKFLDPRKAVKNDPTMESSVTDEAWIFPKKTLLAHCISYRRDISDDELTLFQCRFEILDHRGAWRYSVFTPSRDSKELKLTIYPQNGTDTLRVLDRQKRSLELRVDSLSPDRCIICHALDHSHGDVPKPCGFIPGKG